MEDERQAATLVVETISKWEIVGLWSLFWVNRKWHAATQVVHAATCESFTRIPESNMPRHRKNMLQHVLY